MEENFYVIIEDNSEKDVKIYSIYDRFDLDLIACQVIIGFKEI